MVRCDVTATVSDPIASLSVNHVAAPLWSCGKWNGKRLFMTCINLSYPDGPDPDDPDRNRSSSIHPGYTTAAEGLAVMLGGSGQDCPGIA